MKPKLSIVILSYNVRPLLKKCLESVFADSQSKSWQVIVVDNASGDDSVKWLKQTYKIKEEILRQPETSHSFRHAQDDKADLKSLSALSNKRRKENITLIRSTVNLGFSAGNNLGVKRIGADYTLFLNPDTVVPEGTIPYVLNYLQKHDDVGAATCKVLLPDGRLDDGCHRGFPTPWNSFCHFSGLSKLFPNSSLFSGYSHGHKGFDSPHEIDSLTGAFMMLPTKVGEELDWWDEDYFWNGEDLDFCYRIKQAGFKIMYLPAVQIRHFKGASGGYKSSSHGRGSVSREVKLRAARASTQAMRIFYIKHYSDKYPSLVNWVTLGGIKLMELYRVRKIKQI